MRTFRRTISRLLGGALLFAAHGAVAQQPAAPATDPHAVYERSCNRCHNEHGADFARQKLTLKGQALTVKRTGQALDALLKKHHGVQVTPADVAAMAALFKLGLSTEGAFQLRCGRCHDRAVSLARDALTIADGGMKLKKSGRDLATFLPGHGGTDATPAEIEAITRALRFHLETAPAKP